MSNLGDYVIVVQDLSKYSGDIKSLYRYIGMKGAIISGVTVVGLSLLTKQILDNENLKWKSPSKNKSNASIQLIFMHSLRLLENHHLICLDLAHRFCH